MKKICCFILWLWSIPLSAQEFRQYANGLIYSESAVSQLRHIVDSLNLKFKVCNDHPHYVARSQGRGHYLSFSGAMALKAKSEIEKGLSFDKLVAGFPRATIERDYLAIRGEDKEESDKVTVFYLTRLDNGSGHYITLTDPEGQYLKALKGGWALNYHKKTKYSEEHLEAVYVTEEFITPEIPMEYARMIQYVDCMVDTGYSIFRENYTRSGLWEEQGEPVKDGPYDFVQYVRASINMPTRYEYDEEELSEEEEERKAQIQDSLQWARIDSLSAQPGFRAKLLQAIDLAMKGYRGYSLDLFEEIVEKYDSPATALELKRRRRVIGGCSMDQSPRHHAQAIARLSAETVNWEIFLRAHLDIMNDRFERVSDGNYAWARRKTYLKELETLDFDVPTLLLGTVFRMQEPSGNHYWGSVGRIGRALSETGQPEIVEAKMLHIISDNRLDLYNRLLLYYLFLHYNHNLADKTRKAANINKLRTALATFPEYMRKDAVVAFGKNEG